MSWFARLRTRRPSHALVVAYLALFLAVGGGSTAVALQGRNTVDSGDIINQEVKSADVRNEAIGSLDVRNGALVDDDIQNETLTNSDIANDSVGGDDIFEPSLGQVPSAASVANRAIGANKLGTIRRRTSSVVVPGGVAGNGNYATAEASVACEAGEMAFAGHAHWVLGKDDDDELPLIETAYSHSAGDTAIPRVFHAEGGNDTSEDTTLHVNVFCLQP